LESGLVRAPGTTLSRSAARALYDRIGRWQDTQRFYEDRATADLIAHADLCNARAVFEFGAGTGRLAERLLRDHLPATARYHGIDISSTMVALARERQSPWATRTVVEQSDGSPRFGGPERQFDRFLSTYVLDLLSSQDIAAVFGRGVARAVARWTPRPRQRDARPHAWPAFGHGPGRPTALPLPNARRWMPRHRSVVPP
jgi:SAM-dependent methyltransferase